MKLATLCYVRKNGHTLMMHRIRKDGDVHRGKWNGLGGKFESGESPEQCVCREVLEEAGLQLQGPKLRGFLTFPEFAHGEDWYVFVFLAEHFTGELQDCTEGELHWIPNTQLLDLNLWEGDRVFLPLLDGERLFSGRFCYVGGKLVSHEIQLH